MSPDSKQLEKAINAFRAGKIVIFPTDTAYGIGCRIDDEKAIERLFQIRKRSETKATPVLISSLKMARDYWLYIPDLVLNKLIKPYWPGALTIVLPCDKEKVSSLVRGGGSTLGLRMPKNDNLLTIIEKVGVPILGTSANFAGEKTPFSIDELDPELVEQVDFVLSGESTLRQASTVIDCSQSSWKILRQGGVKINIKN